MGLLAFSGTKHKRRAALAGWWLVWGVLVTSPAHALQNGRVDAIIWFDTEDYLLPASDDAAKRLAEILSQRNIRATFKVVGEKARVLEERGRFDVIAALRKHDIGYHTDFHSVHPTPAEYLASCGLLDGVAEFVRREKQGAADVRRIFGSEMLACYGQPGSSWACQAIIGLKEIGVRPIYLDEGSQVGVPGEPFWYAGVLNVYSLGRNFTRMELHDPAAVEPAKAKVAQIVDELRGKGGGLISICYHPCEWVHVRFWDGVNFSYGANPPREQWRLPQQRPANQTEEAFARFEAYIDHISSLGVRFITASELPDIYTDRVRTEGVTEKELLAIAERLADQKATGVDYQPIMGGTVSAADQFELLVTAAGRLIDGQQPGGRLLARGILGPDSSPEAVVHDGRMVAWPAFRDAARDVQDYLRTHERVPARVFIGADSVSPADFLSGLAKVYAYYFRNGSLPLEGVTLGVNLSVLPERHVADAPAGRFDWVIHRPDFRAARILDVARLQAWTFKPAVRRQDGTPELPRKLQATSQPAKVRLNDHYFGFSHINGME